MKKELAKCFPSKAFSWIDDNLPEEEDEVEGEHVEDTLNVRVSLNNLIGIKNTDIMETRTNDPEDPSPVSSSMTLMRISCHYFH